MALAILAAGQSQRFGEQDKLASKLGGKMLGLHVAEALSGLPFDHKAVVTVGDHPCADHWDDLGFEIVINDEAQEGQATSVQAAARFARDAGANSLCICLADMPFVDAAHIEKLVAEFADLRETQIVASSNGDRTMPPAIFPSQYFGRLMALQGDQGARKLLDGAQSINVKEPILMDIDSNNDLREAGKIITK